MVDENGEVLDKTLEVSPESETPEEVIEETPEESTKEPAETEQPGQAAFDGDINKLPAELQTVAKGFQADYTRKVQALQKAVESFEPHKERLALLDRAISGDPNARKVLGDMFGEKVAPQAPEPEEIPESFKTVNDMLGFLEKRLDRRYKDGFEKKLEEFQRSMVDTLSPIMQQTQHQTAQAAMNQAKAKYKDFDEHIPTMVELSKSNPYLNYDQLYKLATYDKRPIPSSKQTLKPGVRPSSAKVDDASMKGLSSWERTLVKTERDLAALGEKVTLFTRK